MSETDLIGVAQAVGYIGSNVLPVQICAVCTSHICYLHVMICPIGASEHNRGVFARDTELVRAVWSKVKEHMGSHLGHTRAA
jgi:hypothetical protein